MPTFRLSGFPHVQEGLLNDEYTIYPRIAAGIDKWLTNGRSLVFLAWMVNSKGPPLRDDILSRN